MSLSALSSIGGSYTSTSDRATIADNFDTFLTLLTTQLRNQNPLDPLDTNQFTQQLVQFSGVEQQIKANANLEAMIQLSAAQTATQAASFIGKKVMVESTTTDLKDGKAEWSYAAASGATSATFTVRDADGKVVWTESKEITAGRHDYAWTGRDNEGNQLPAGKYTLTVDATNDKGETLQTVVEDAALIDGVDFTGSEPLLIVGEYGIRLSDVRAVLSG